VRDRAAPRRWSEVSFMQGEEFMVWGLGNISSDSTSVNSEGERGLMFFADAGWKELKPLSSIFLHINNV